MKRFFAAALAIVLPFNYWASSASDADPGNTRVYLPAVANGAAPNESGSLPSSPQGETGEPTFGVYFRASGIGDSLRRTRQLTP